MAYRLGQRHRRTMFLVIRAPRRRLRPAIASVLWRIDVALALPAGDATNEAAGHWRLPFGCRRWQPRASPANPSRPETLVNRPFSTQRDPRQPRSDRFDSRWRYQILPANTGSAYRDRACYGSTTMPRSRAAYARASSAVASGMLRLAARERYAASYGVIS